MGLHVKAIFDQFWTAPDSSDRNDEHHNQSDHDTRTNAIDRLKRHSSALLTADIAELTDASEAPIRWIRPRSTRKLVACGESEAVHPPKEGTGHACPAQPEFATIEANAGPAKLLDLRNDMDATSQPAVPSHSRWWNIRWRRLPQVISIFRDCGAHHQTFQAWKCQQRRWRDHSIAPHPAALKTMSSHFTATILQRSGNHTRHHDGRQLDPSEQKLDGSS